MDPVLELLTEFLDVHPGGDGALLEGWIGARPELAGAPERAARLRSALAEWRDAGDLLGLGGLGPVSEEEPPRPVGPRHVPGSRIGHFELRRFIASGSMGQVWEAEDLHLRRRVALKLVLPTRINPRSLELFAREARAGGRLSHPNLVATLAYGSDGELAWIAQELVPGSRTLRDGLERLRAEEGVPRGHDRRVARLVARLARGLHAAHEAGVIHRDIKPANVLLTDEDEPKLTDFGLARVQDDSFHSASHELVGTWAYMSPEQLDARGAAVDRRADVFALGILLYELLAMRRPFEGDTTAQVADRILHHEPPPLRSIRSQVPEELAVIAGKALQKVRAARYATALELAEDLERFLAGEPIRARPPGPAARARRWLRRNPATSAAASVLVVALAVVSWLSVHLAEQSRLARNEREAVLRLAAQQDLEDLVREQAELWPAVPARLPELRRWEARARELLAELPEHRATLAALDAGERVAEGASRTRWWRERLTRLIAELEALELELLDPAAITTEHGWSVTRRISCAEELEERFTPGSPLRLAWERDLPGILADHPGLPLGPRPDLLPVGRDPRSGLWEFAHLPSGEAARRGADGELEIGPETGLVLVLIPAGRDHLGSQAEDPEAPNHDPVRVPYDPRLREVELPAFLLSKYELTQAQWRRATGAEPSTAGYGVEAAFLPDHPVELVTWPECAEVSRRFGLALPTEEEWEYAARAGTDTPYWTGRDLAGLARAANVADLSQDKTSSIPWIEHDPIDDGFANPAPVGTFAPNPFGLHEILGNVWEWCENAYNGKTLPLGAAELAALEPGTPVLHGYRGGSFNDRALHARASAGLRDVEGYKTYAIGLRPALRLETVPHTR